MGNLSSHDGTDPAVTEAVETTRRWLAAARADGDGDGPSRQLRHLIADADGVAFAIGFVDRVARPDDPGAAAAQLRSLVVDHRLPRFLSPTDRLLLWTGARLAPHLPRLVMPLARRRLRQLVGHLVVDAEPSAMAAHLAAARADGYGQNVNLLGEAVLGRREADRRLAATAALIDQPHVDYVSVKISAVAAQLNHWDWPGSLDRVTERLRLLFERAAASDPPTFVNLDMEEYHDLELTVAAFRAVLDDPAFTTSSAGIVLQTYLPDAFDALGELVGWAGERQRRGGAPIKIRLVKGANLAMERVEAALGGWPQAPFDSKAAVDANFKKCLDWVLRPDRMAGVRIGVASHNLFDVAWALHLARTRGVGDRVEVEMLHGMAPAQARVVADDPLTDRLLVYTPIVADTDFDVAISYLVRRLEENAQAGNYLRSLLDPNADRAAFDAEAIRFRRAVADRRSLDTTPRRTVQQPAQAAHGRGAPHFVNEPDTDPAVAANRAWAEAVVAAGSPAPSTPMTTDVDAVTAAVDRAVAAGAGWAATPTSRRRELLHDVADELARRRGDLVAAMVHEAHKPLAEADTEVSEAIDFARWYGDRAPELDRHPDVGFAPLGVVAVVPPWNFPVAIPAGGVLAALAAGNSVILKPAPETPRCAELVAECCWAGGIASDVLQFVRTPDDEVGRTLITSVDGVILTGSFETARLFRSWRPDLPVFAETSGKNALVITPNADIDQAVADLVHSAFGHAGQKCSAASLAVCVGSVFHSRRFRRQLVDAVESLEVTWPTSLAATVGPIIGPASPELERGLTRLDAGEQWLVEPVPLDPDRRLWRPGVRIGVRPRSWFHRTECFGPVLGLMAAPDLTTAIRIQNDTGFGLTGGIHSLASNEIEQWCESVEVGNAYVNRSTTGAIVGRQPFGGWKRSSVGPGAKAGGPNYVAQLGTWLPRREPQPGQPSLRAAAATDDARWWETEFSRTRELGGLFCEANLFRYRPLPMVALRIELDADPDAVDRVVDAAARCDVPLLLSQAPWDDEDHLLAMVDQKGIERIRVVGTPTDRLRRGRGRRHGPPGRRPRHHQRLGRAPALPPGAVDLPYHPPLRQRGRRLTGSRGPVARSRSTHRSGSGHDVRVRHSIASRWAG